MSIYNVLLGVPSSKSEVFLYTVGVYTPNGRVARQYYASSRSEAVRDAYADGLTVIDCDYHPHD